MDRKKIIVTAGLAIALGSRSGYAEPDYQGTLKTISAYVEYLAVLKSSAMSIIQNYDPGKTSDCAKSLLQILIQYEEFMQDQKKEIRNTADIRDPVVRKKMSSLNAGLVNILRNYVIGTINPIQYAIDNCNSRSIETLGYAMISFNKKVGNGLSAIQSDLDAP